VERVINSSVIAETWRKQKESIRGPGVILVFFVR